MSAYSINKGGMSKWFGTSGKCLCRATVKVTGDFLHTYLFFAISIGKLLRKPLLKKLRKTF